MPKETIELVDTVIKIGLGSLITGLVSFFVSRLHHQKEKERYLLDHRIRTFESAVENMEGYFDAFARLMTRSGGIARYLESQGKGLNQVSNDQKKTLIELNRKLQESWQSKNFAQVRFKLLGASKVVKSLKYLSGFQEDFRDNLFVKEGITEKIASYSQFEKTRDKYTKIRDKYEQEIALFYRDIST